MKHCNLIIVVLCCIIGLLTGGSHVVAKEFSVLVVMSYEETYPWCQDTLAGISSVLKEKATITTSYMNTKIDYQGGPAKAMEAYRLFQKLQPDGVIAADDNAQSMFVLPYLKNVVKTPVMFCGVNAEPEEYGYPANNVSGILERLHVRDSILLAKQLVPSISAMGFIMQAGPSAEKITNQFKNEQHTYPVKFVGARWPRTVDDALAMTKELSEMSDLLFMETLQGLKQADGTPLEYKKIMPLIAESFGKTVIASDDYAVRYGALCAVVKTGQEQGRTAASMLLRAMQGTPVSELPITRNREGKRMINVTVLRNKGISPPPDIVRTSELVTTVH